MDFFRRHKVFAVLFLVLALAGTALAVTFGDDITFENNTTFQGTETHSGTVTFSGTTTLPAATIGTEITVKTCTIADSSATNTTGNDATIASGTLLGAYPATLAGSGAFLNSVSMNASGNITCVLNSNSSGVSTIKVVVLEP